jgi:hypothetical protein
VPIKTVQIDADMMQEIIPKSRTRQLFHQCNGFSSRLAYNTDRKMKV